MSLDVSQTALSRAAKRAAELFTEIHSELENRRVDPGVTRESMQMMFANSIDEEGVGLDQVLEEFHKKVLPNSMGTPHPLYLGLVNSSPLPAGPLADLLVSSLNNNGGAFHQSPAMSAIEQEVIAEFGKLCGFENGHSGMILPGGTFANLQALLLARQAHFPEWQSEGPAALPGQPTLYRSAATHFCNDRSARVMGLGERGLVPIPTCGRGSMNVAALESRIQADRQQGRLPFAVVANAGTTGTGALDDIDAIATICQRFGLWLHVDACYGGGALLLDPPLPEFCGIERADSVAIDPHKWFFVPMTAGLLLTRHPQLEIETFDFPASYIPGDGVVDPLCRGLPTSRRSSGLTVWMILRAHGWQVIRESVTRNVHLTRLLEAKLAQQGFRVLANGQLSVACARWENVPVSGEALDRIQSSLATKVVATGKAWFSTVVHQDQTWLRFNMVNLHTREHHIEQLAGILAEAVHQL